MEVQKKVIDSMMFFNEFDTLKFRLSYLNDIVDYFIICESNYTHSGKSKPYYLDQILNDIPQEICKKIIRLKYEPNINEIDSHIGYSSNNWKRERQQRDLISQNLSTFSPSDFFMVSDVDEIPRKEVIQNLLNRNENDFIYAAECEMFYYNFKTFVHNEWKGTIFSNVNNAIKYGCDYFRNFRNQFQSIKNGGWHFSYFAEIETIKYKIDSTAHQEYNNENYNTDLNIKNSIQNKRYLFDREHTFKNYNFNNFPENLKNMIVNYFDNKYYIRVFVFGANGMLGRYITEYLSPEFEVISITRNEIDLQKDFSLITEKYDFQSNDVIINAAGIIKQRKYSPEELIRVNSIFPHFLSDLNCNVIHITTDCVFNGKNGSYTEDSLHDCLDDYGKSKSLGENHNLTIIRTSIIGEELENKKSLIEWVKSNCNTNINGYLNHFWNGVTCLELSRHISDIIKNKSYWKGVRHYHSPDTVSKYQLVSYINDIYELNNIIKPVMSEYCDRSLSTNYRSPIKLNIEEQIKELKNFNLTLKEEKNKVEHIYHQDKFGENWFTYPNLYSSVVERFSSGAKFVEIGSWKGKSSAYMAIEIANSDKDIDFCCVDTWQGGEEHQNFDCLSSLYETFINNMKPVENYYRYLKMTSLEAVEQFEDNSLDFVFIDASHEYEDVKADILAWIRKVKPGGILAGHDYYVNTTIRLCGVNEAVDECLDKFDTSEDCFIYYKPNQLGNFPSFNFVSIEESEERREKLYKNFKEYGLTNIRPNIFKRYQEGDLSIKYSNKNWFIPPQDYFGKEYLGNIGALISHLKAIKTWYDNTNEEYAFFCEDDISFETVEYWNFTWEEFFNKLPNDWECVQLSISRVEPTMFNFFQPEVHLRERRLCDFSCCAYLIKRSHAKKLLDAYYDGEVLIYDYKGDDYEYRLYSNSGNIGSFYPFIENIIYSIFGGKKIYTFPLFVEDPNNISTLNGQYKESHNTYPHKSITNWWKERGCNMDLNNLITGNL
jgi:dTDP-4-dehydrorhamnose reductase